MPDMKKFDNLAVSKTTAKMVREVTDDNIMRMRESAGDYVKRGIEYKAQLKRIG